MFVQLRIGDPERFERARHVADRVGAVGMPGAHIALAIRHADEIGGELLHRRNDALFDEAQRGIAHDGGEYRQDQHQGFADECEGGEVEGQQSDHGDTYGTAQSEEGGNARLGGQRALHEPARKNRLPFRHRIGHRWGVAADIVLRRPNPPILAIVRGDRELGMGIHGVFLPETFRVVFLRLFG